MADTGPGSLLALRDRREAVIQILTESFANDLVDVEAFDERLMRAHGAETVAELDALVEDLKPLPEVARRVPLARIPVDAAPERPRAISAVFSNVERRGAWRVPSAMMVRSVFGNAELDFREARFAAGETKLHVSAVFGNVEIVVPPHLAVECEGTAIFGSFQQGEHVVADPDRPMLRIVGRAVFGNVEIKMLLPGETERDARRRRKRERKALAAVGTPALPSRRD